MRYLWIELPKIQVYLGKKLEDHLLPGHPILFRPLKTSASCGWAAAHNPPRGSRSGITSVIIIGHDNHGQNLGI
jgi:hypothetical protein